MLIRQTSEGKEYYKRYACMFFAFSYYSKAFSLEMKEDNIVIAVAHPDKMTPKERMEALLAGRPYDRVPCALHVRNQAGILAGINPWDCYFSVEKTVQTQIAAYEIFGVEELSVGPSLQGIAEAAGSKVIYPASNNSQYIGEVAIKQPADLAKLAVPDPRKDGRLPINLQALEILQDKLGSTLPIVTTIAGAFTTAGNLRGVEPMLREIYKNPEFVHKLLRFSLDSTIAYVKAAAKLGVEFYIAEPTASTTLISPKQFREFAFPYLKELICVIVELTGRAPTLHICGNTSKIWPDMVDTGAGILSLDNMIDLSVAKERVGHLIAISGNVKPTASMYLGTPEDVIRDAKQCLLKGYDNPKGFILALGCALPAGAPPENIHAFMYAVREFGRYPIDPARLQR